MILSPMNKEFALVGGQMSQGQQYNQSEQKTRRQSILKRLEPFQVQSQSLLTTCFGDGWVEEGAKFGKFDSQGGGKGLEAHSAIPNKV